VRGVPDSGLDLGSLFHNERVSTSNNRCFSETSLGKTSGCNSDLNMRRQNHNSVSFAKSEGEYDSSHAKKVHPA